VEPQTLEKTHVPPTDRIAADLLVKPEDDDEGDRPSK